MPGSKKHLRILFIAQAVSIHTARWISQLNDQGWDLHVFDMLGSFPHAELQGVTEYSLLVPRKIPIVPKEPSYGHEFFLARGWDPFPISLAGFFIRRLFRRRAQRLAGLIRKLKPDVIHAIELQTQGYELLPVMDIVGDLGAPCILSTWGSDLFYFQQFPAHLEKIQKLLSRCDYLIPDCHRDEALARELGFRGQIPLVLPGSGGYPVEKMRRLMAPGPVRARRLIMVKGYQGWAGRAQDAIDALGLCSDVLSDYEIVVYVASDSVRKSVAEMRARRDLNIRILERSPHADILKLFGRARLAIAVNITDGIPNAMLEAMTMGAFPIQSNTESTAEWITDGRNGLLVKPGDPVGIAAAIRRALMDDVFVDQAAESNRQLVTERLDLSTVKPRVIEVYHRVAASRGRS